MNAKNTIRIELTAEELELIYDALNDKCCKYSSKSETFKQMDEGKTLYIDVEPDFWFRKWEEAGRLNHRIYTAEQKLAKKLSK